MSASPPQVELYVGNYGRVRYAIGVDYDEAQIRRLRALWDDLDWETHHTDREDEYEFADGTRRFAWLVDRSSEVRRRLREEAGVGFPPDEDLPWAVDTYRTSPGDDPRECASCGEQAVLGPRGLVAANVTGSAKGSPSILNAASEIVESDQTSANVICTQCGQLYEYDVPDAPDGETATDGSGDPPDRITGSTEAYEVM